MKELAERNDEWQPCTKGELRGVVQQMVIRRKNRATANFAGIVSGALIVTACSMILVDRFRQSEDSGNRPLACAKVKELIPALAAGQLDERQIEAVHNHLRTCARCRPVYQQMLSQMDHISLDNVHACRTCRCCTSDDSTRRSVIEPIFAIMSGQ